MLVQKDGASTNASPASLPDRHRVANASQVSAKLRALAEAMGGPCIVRDTDGNGYLLTVEALKFIPFHSSAFSSGAKQHHA